MPMPRVNLDPHQQFKLKSPCSQCPFRTDIDFRLHPDRARDIWESITLRDEQFICHKTADLPSPKMRVCAGSMILLRHEEKLHDNHALRFAVAFGFLDPDALNMDAPVFIRAQEWVQRMIDFEDQ